MTTDINITVHDASLQGSAARALHTEMRRLVAPQRQIVLNMSRVEQVDTRGAGAILEIANRLRERGGSIRLVGLRNNVIAFFELLRMHRSIEIFGAQSDALTMAQAA